MTEQQKNPFTLSPEDLRLIEDFVRQAKLSKDLVGTESFEKNIDPYDLPFENKPIKERISHIFEKKFEEKEERINKFPSYGPYETSKNKILKNFFDMAGISLAPDTPEARRARAEAEARACTQGTRKPVQAAPRARFLPRRMAPGRE